MASLPPTGSSITISREGAQEVLRVPHASKGAMPYFIAAFLIFWLGGWTMGFKSAVEDLMKKQDNLFLIFWLGGWTVGGLFAIYSVYCILRPSVPESFRLRANGVTYDSGVAPFQMSSGDANQKNAWKSLYRKRLVREFTASDLRTLKLRETENGNRLTIDKDNQRLDLAGAASEVEREWLYGYLSKRYS